VKQIQSKTKKGAIVGPTGSLSTYKIVIVKCNYLNAQHHKFKQLLISQSTPN